MAIPYLALGILGLGGYLLYRRSQPSTPPPAQGNGLQIQTGVLQLPPPVDVQPLVLQFIPGTGTTCSSSSATKDKHLAALPWITQQTVEVPIFTPSSECEDYQIRTGICLAAPSAFAYGDLLKNPAQAILNIRESKKDEYGQGVNLSSFASPVVWKRQYRIHISFKNGNLQILQPYMAVPDSLPEVDPCPLVDERWAESKTGVFWVTDDKAIERIWQVEPYVTIFVKNQRLFLRLRYSGLPYFKYVDVGGDQSDYVVARTEPNYQVGYVLNVKTEAEGGPA